MNEEMEHNSLERSIGQLQGKLDSVLTMTGDIKGDVASLRNDFSTMEKGRLTQLEVSFVKLSTEITLKAKNSAFLMAAIISVIVSVLSALITYFVIH